MDPDGDVYVADWGNDRLRIYTADGGYVADLIGDAQQFTKWAHMQVDVSPDRIKALRRAKTLEPQWRLCKPAAVTFDPETNRVMVCDSLRGRLQIYAKLKDYSEPPITL